MEIFFGFVIGALILSIVVDVYCALKIADHSYKNNYNNNEEDGDMLKKQICLKYKIDERTHDLDPK